MRGVVNLPATQSVHVASAADVTAQGPYFPGAQGEPVQDGDPGVGEYVPVCPKITGKRTRLQRVSM